MSNSVAVVPFQFQNNSIRTVTLDGEPWFVAKDVCDVLGIADNTTATRDLEADELTRIVCVSGGQHREMNAVNESGLYALIFKSRKPEAKAFRRWVTSEVLPTLRKTGKYGMPQAPARPFSQAGLLADEFEGAQRLAKLCGLEGNQALLKADKVVRKLHGASPLALLEIELKTPNNEALIIATEMSKRLNPPISVKNVNRTLAAMGLQERVEYKPNKYEWRLTEKGKEYGTYLDVGRSHSDGTPVLQIKWRESVTQLVENHLSN